MHQPRRWCVFFHALSLCCLSAAARAAPAIAPGDSALSDLAEGLEVNAARATPPSHEARWWRAKRPSPRAASLAGPVQALVITHGIGNADTKWLEDFKDLVRQVFDVEVERISGKRPPRQALVMQTGRWAHVTSADQERSLRAYAERHGQPTLLREIKARYAGDALSYAADKKQAIKAAIISAVEDVGVLADRASPGAVADLSVVGHSWGAVAGSDALWDMAQDTQFPQENLEWQHFVTMGSPLETVLRKHQPHDMASPVRPHRWTNVWYEGDATAGPLDIVNPEYAAIVDELRLNTARHVSRLRSLALRLVSSLPRVSHFFGRRLQRFPGVKSWVQAFLETPAQLTHRAYWSDPRVLRAIARPMAERYCHRRAANPARQSRSAAALRRASRESGRPRLVAGRRSR